MRLSLEIDAHRHFVRSYGPGWVNVSEREIRQSVIVTPERLVTDWPPQAFADLEEVHFEAVVRLEPEILVLGTGTPSPGNMGPGITAPGSARGAIA